MSIEGVEIDDKITALSNNIFLPDDVKVTTYDGRAYLSDRRENMTLSGGCLPDITIPFQMSSVEFLRWSKHFKEHKRERRDGRKHEYAR